MNATSTGKILGILASVISLFNLNAVQSNKLNSYVKANMYEWVEKRKTDSEVEAMIKAEARTLN